MADELELETIITCKDALKLGLARGILENAGIPYLLKGQTFGPASSIRAFPALTGDMPFELQVAKDRAEEARALVAQLKRVRQHPEMPDSTHLAADNTHADRVIRRPEAGRAARTVIDGFAP